MPERTAESNSWPVGDSKRVLLRSSQQKKTWRCICARISIDNACVEHKRHKCLLGPINADGTDDLAIKFLEVDLRQRGIRSWDEDVDEATEAFLSNYNLFDWSSE